MRKSVLTKSLPPRLPISQKIGTNSLQKRHDFTPVSFDKYFETVRKVTILNSVFNIYQTGSTGPVLFFLHGGGYSGLSWACVAKEVTNVVSCRCVAPDLRGHGETVTNDELNLEINQMAQDVLNIINDMFTDENLSLVLVGHSMGGALASQVAARSEELTISLAGLIVIDVVEGTALGALTHMPSFLRSRPAQFHSATAAVEWSVKTGQVRNIEAARVSVPGMLKRITPNDSVATTQARNTSDAASLSGGMESISEDDTTEPIEDDHPIASATNEPDRPVTWRIDLAQTEPHWRGWFDGMSQRFLSAPCPKMLILAGVDRLDAALTVAQMQGKFQLQVLDKVGHTVHEDAPDKVADVLATFLVRHRLVEATDKFLPAVPCC